MSLQTPIPCCGFDFHCRMKGERRCNHLGVQYFPFARLKSLGIVGQRLSPKNSRAIAVKAIAKDLAEIRFLLRRSPDRFYRRNDGSC